MNFKIKNQNDKAGIISYIEKLKDGKMYDVSISIHRENRTINQNSLYQLWINYISEDTGGDREQIKNEFRDK